jgi:hypothetical protein
MLEMKIVPSSRAVTIRGQNGRMVKINKDQAIRWICQMINILESKHLVEIYYTIFAENILYNIGCTLYRMYSTSAAGRRCPAGSVTLRWSGHIFCVKLPYGPGKLLF